MNEKRKKQLIFVCAFLVIVIAISAIFVVRHNTSIENGERLFEEFGEAGLFVYTGEELTGISEYWWLCMPKADYTLEEAVRDINAYRKSIDLPPLEIVSAQDN